MSEKTVLVVGNISPKLGNYRVKTMDFVTSGEVLTEIDIKPILTAEEAWRYLDGEVLE